MNPQLITLKNGLKIILADTKSPSLTTLLLVGAGSRYENEKNNLLKKSSPELLP